MAALFLVAALGAAAFGIASGAIAATDFGPNLDQIAIGWAGMGVAAGVSIVLILNLLGLTVRPKLFGGAGLLIALALVILGIYVLATNNPVFPIDPQYTSMFGGITLGAGAFTLLTSAGVATL